MNRPAIAQAAAFAPLLLFFFVSGACGLLYQVVWTRQLALLFGVTHYAVSTVLCIFFLGLAAGSLWGGRLAERTPAPLRWYALIEIAIGLWALLFLLALSYGEGLVVALLQAAGNARELGIALRALLAMALLFAPVALMGATLPLLAQHISRAGAATRRIGLLYSINTFGAMTGCMLTGFLLLEHLGYTQTTLIGAALNIAVGILALALGALRPASPPLRGDLGGCPPPTHNPPHTHDPHGIGILCAFAISGFCFLGLEVVWTRLLAIVFLGTTYAFTTMLTVVLLGIALGGALGAFVAARTRHPALLFGCVLLASGVLTLWQLSAIAALPEILVASAGSGDWAAEVRQKFWLSMRALLPTTLIFGATFALAIKALSPHGVPGRIVGRAYAWNTLGGVAGSLVGGFVLLPLLGAHHTMLLLAAMLMGAGVMLLRGAGMQTRAVILAVTATTSAFMLLRAPADLNAALNIGYVPPTHEVLTVREGAEGTVVVTQPAGETAETNRVLWINRVQATASIERGVRMNRMQGVLPHLFDRDVDQVLFMCFGSGVTCGTLALGGFEHIDAVEISREVLAVAPLFNADNLGVLKRPGIAFHIDDGRNFLLVIDKQYDFITFEPMPLAMAGVSTFYTREYYEQCLAHLRPRGMVSQWVPLHSLNPEVVRSLVATFSSVFPHHCAWFINADLFLIGSNEPLALDVEAARARLAQPELQAALQRAGFPDIEELYACFMLDSAGVRAFAEGGRIMTDNRPWAEFEAPKLVYARTVQDSIAALQQHAASPLALMPPPQQASPQAARIQQRHKARMNDMDALKIYYGEPTIGSAAFDLFNASLDIDPLSANSKLYLRQIALQQGERYIQWLMFDEAEHVLTNALAHLPNDPDLQALTHQLAAKRTANQ